ncbi:MAG: radical SAM protein [Candidatus Omnitrophica bacterium]|nr:radical SAM protein [Candidatus Omnitrophota bacterium]
MDEQMKFLESQGRQVEIESDTFRKIIRETKDLGTKVILFIGGEPLLRKDLFDLVGYARSLGLSAVIVTNGVLLNRENIERCLRADVDWLSVSIDAATEERFSKIRGENILGEVIRNIEQLNSSKRNKNREFPKIVAVCTIMDDNLEELLDIVNLAKRIEIEKVLFQPVVASNIDQTQRDNNYPGVIPTNRLDVLDKAIDKLIDYKRESIQNFNFIGNSIRHLQLIKRYFRDKVKPCHLPCYAGYNRLQIVQEGKLYFCVSQQEFEATFGNVKVDSLKSLWFSKRARFYRRLIRKCKFPCLQWCSYRDDFFELEGILQKILLFR